MSWKHLISKSALFLSAILLMLSTVGIIIGHQQPPSVWATILHLDMCELPCWIGIIPGRTTLAEARRKIEEVYSDPALYSIEANEQKDAFGVIYKPTTSSFVIAFTPYSLSENPHSIIQGTYIGFDLRFNQLNSKGTKLPTIPDLYNSLGNPESIRLSSGAEEHNIALFFKGGNIVVSLNNLECDRVRLNQEILSISLDAQITQYAAWVSKPHAWQGFGKCYHLVRSIE